MEIVDGQCSSLAPQFLNQPIHSSRELRLVVSNLLAGLRLQLPELLDWGVSLSQKTNGLRGVLCDGMGIPLDVEGRHKESRPCQFPCFLGCHRVR